MVLIAGVAIYIASSPSQSIMDLVEFAWAGLGATFGSVMVGSLYWRRMTRNGAVAGMLGGALTVLLWRAGGLNAIWGYELLPATVVSSTCLVITSLCSQRPSKAVFDQFDAVKKMVRSLRTTKIEIDNRK